MKMTSLLRFIRAWILVFGSFTLTMVVSCKDKKTTSPAPQRAPQEQPGDDERRVNEDDGDTRENEGSNAEIVLPSGTSASDLNYRQNDTVRLKLGLSGIDGNSNYEFGLVNAPAGAQLLGQGGDEPELVWKPGAAGNYDMTVVARDMDLCEQVLNSARDCELKGSSIEVDSRFDVTKSLAFKIEAGNVGDGGFNGGYGQDDQCNDQGGGGLLSGIGRGITDFFGDLFGGGFGDFFGGDCDNGGGSGGGFGGDNDTGYGGGSGGNGGGSGGTSNGGFGGGGGW